MRLRLLALPQSARLGIYAAAVAALLYLCLAPAEGLPSQRLWDKAEHGLAWLALAGLGLAFWPRRPQAVSLFALGLGGLVEALQAGVDLGRQGDWRDLAADAMGVALALVAWAAARARAVHTPAGSRKA